MSASLGASRGDSDRPLDIFKVLFEEEGLASSCSAKVTAFALQRFQ